MGVPSTRDREEYLVFGWTPEEADAVELVRDGEVVERVPTVAGPASVNRDSYLMTLPPDIVLDGLMRWIGEDGRAVDEVRFRLP